VTEAQWVETIASALGPILLNARRALTVVTGKRIAYGHEILGYTGPEPKVSTNSFQTDLAILERSTGDEWRPRVIVEAKIGSITTHDAITYSHKAQLHRTVHPYLRYGVMLGQRGHFPLPGRLFRHGQHFDFMFSFEKAKPSRLELAAFARLIRYEVEASRRFEKVLYDSRKRDREHFTVLHRRLVLE